MNYSEVKDSGRVPKKGKRGKYNTKWSEPLDEMQSNPNVWYEFEIGEKGSRRLRYALHRRVGKGNYSVRRSGDGTYFARVTNND